MDVGVDWMQVKLSVDKKKFVEKHLRQIKGDGNVVLHFWQLAPQPFSIKGTDEERKDQCLEQAYWR